MVENTGFDYKLALISNIITNTWKQWQINMLSHK